MVEIQKLFGVLPGCSVNWMLLQSEVYLKPSEQLLSELSQLPAGTRVGIEEFEPSERAKLDDLVIDGLPCMPDEGSTRYWQRVAEQCRQSRLEIVHLDDPITWVDAARQEVQVHQLNEKINRRRSAQEFDALSAQMYACGVEQQYISWIRRERAIFEKIKAAQPAVVVLSDGFADDLVIRPTDGISVLSYAKEEAPNMQVLRREMGFIHSDLERYTVKAVAEQLSSRIGPNTLVQNAQPQAAVVPEREALERRYRAVKTGRITDRKPDFIGTWATDIPARGLFELFIVGRAGTHFVGTIEDTIGSATFHGRIDENNINFTKVYDAATHSIRGPMPPCKGEVAYTARKSNGKYEGTFHHPTASGSFEMAEFKG